MVENVDQKILRDERTDELPQSMRPETLKLLFDVASDAFKQQRDTDESIWRTLPFVGALFGFAIPVIRFASPHYDFSGSWLEVVGGSFYILSIFSFAVAFGYLWPLVKPRYFEYPADIGVTRDYAQTLTRWYAENKEHYKRIDAKVVDDVRVSLIDQYAKASSANMGHIERRLLARSRTITFLLAGFALISLSEMLMFGHDRFVAKENSTRGNHSSSQSAAPPGAIDRAPQAPQNKTGTAGR